MVHVFGALARHFIKSPRRVEYGVRMSCVMLLGNCN
jgi:hypothetical protein